MKKYYIKERFNPQFETPYYVKLGQLTKKDAIKYEKSLYGDNYILSYDIETEYNKKITELKLSGYKIY